MVMNMNFMIFCKKKFRRKFNLIKKKPKHNHLSSLDTNCSHPPSPFLYYKNVIMPFLDK